MALIGETSDGGEGFAIATMTSPRVRSGQHDRAGRRLRYALWESLGATILNEVTRAAKARGAVQIVVVCVAKDAGKRRLLAANQLGLVCEWHFKRFVKR